MSICTRLKQDILDCPDSVGHLCYAGGVLSFHAWSVHFSWFGTFHSVILPSKFELNKQSNLDFVWTVVSLNYC